MNDLYEMIEKKLDENIASSYSEKKEKEFIDQLRTRNGNLTIVCGRATTTAEYM